MITKQKAGDAALDIVDNCIESVKLDPHILEKDKRYALNILLHIHMYFTLEQIGEYRNGY